MAPLLLRPSAARRPAEFRVDIEGLRAFAVLAVIIHHAWPSALPGGFVGVDVFFVISGYLIGAHLIAGFAAGTLSFGQFYARRARRILPSLVIVLACVWMGASLIFTAAEFSNLGLHVLASAAFANNFILARETGYFDAPALTKPLLHLWSLAVEEQFYGLVPLLVAVGLRRGKGLAAWTVRLATLSLVWTLTLADTRPAASFFFLHTRFWELGAGVLLAATQAGREQARSHDAAIWPGARERQAWLLLLVAGSMLGLLAVLHQGDASLLERSGTAAVVLLGLIGLYASGRSAPQDTASVVRSDVLRAIRAAAAPAGALALLGAAFLSSPGRWPSGQTVWPVLGALLVIAFPSGAVQRLLGSAPATAIGAISYPLYLWHWPLEVGWRMLYTTQEWYAQLAPLGAAFALAWLTKLLIEDPCRFGLTGRHGTRRLPLWALPACLAMVGGAGLLSLATGGLPQRFSTQLRAIAVWHQDWTDMKWRIGSCYFEPDSGKAFSPECSPARHPERPLVLLWGDSHAAHFSPALQAMALHGELDFAQWTQGSCPPTSATLQSEGAGCAARRAGAMRQLAEYKPDVLLISGAWALYQRWGSSEEQIVAGVSQSVRTAQAAGIPRIVLFGDGPNWHAALPSELYRFMARERLARVPPRFGTATEAAWKLDAALAKASQELGIAYFSVLSDVCDRSGCRPVVRPDADLPEFLYWDESHLTAAGAAHVLIKARPLLLGSD